MIKLQVRGKGFSSNKSIFKNYTNLQVTFTSWLKSSDHDMTDRITKRWAVEAVGKTFNLSLDKDTTHFANVNTRQPVWWLDIPVEKCTSGKHEYLDLLLVSDDSVTIYHLQIPTAYFRENQSRIHIRRDKHSFSLELSSRDDKRFQDVRPKGEHLPFSQFLLNTLRLK